MAYPCFIIRVDARFSYDLLESGAGGGNRTIHGYSFYVTYCKHTNARTAQPAVCPPPMYKIMYNEIGRCGVAHRLKIAYQADSLTDERVNVRNWKSFSLSKMDGFPVNRTSNVLTRDWRSIRLRGEEMPAVFSYPFIYIRSGSQAPADVPILKMSPVKKRHGYVCV